MHTKPSIVPSKDALRALRSIALSSQAAFACALGSACGLAAINYHERRKVRYAERMLESKKTIHSISGGRGKARMGLMFEAAERGDDFVLHHGRSKKSQRRSNYNLATSRTEEQDMQQHDTSGRRHSEALLLEEQSSSRNTSDSPAAVIFKPWIDIPPSVNSDSVDHSSIEKELENPSNVTPIRAKKAQKGGRSSLHDGFGGFFVETISPKDRPRSISRTGQHIPGRDPTKIIMRPQNFAELAVKAAQLRAQKKWTLSDNKTVTSRAVDPANGMRLAQNQTDLNPVPDSVYLADDVPVGPTSALPAEESIFFNWVFEKPSVDDVFHSNFFKLSEPTRMTEVEADAGSSNDITSSRSLSSTSATHVRRNQKSSTSGDAPLQASGLYLQYHDQIPDHSPSRLTSRFDPDQSRGRKHIRDAHRVDEVNPSRYRYVFNQIAATLEGEGVDRAVLLLHRTLRDYCTTRNPTDFQLAKLLIMDFALCLPGPHLTLIISKVVRELLSDSHPQTRAVSLLYPRFGEQWYDDHTLPKRYADLAKRYMTDFCNEHSKFEDQFAELQKVISGTIECKVPISHELMVPVLRSMFKQGQSSHAQKCYDHITQQYELPVSLISLSEMTRGYAAEGNWWKVKNLLFDPNLSELPWKRINSYSQMFAHTIDSYTIKYSVDKLCAYVMTAIEQAGLFPTAQVSDRVVIACIKARRFDLLAQYIMMIQRDFPYLKLGSKRPAFALALGQAWQRMDATCTDVLETCKVLALNAVDDPFSGPLKHVAGQAVVKAVDPVLKELQSAGGSSTPNVDPFEDIENLASNIRRTVTHHANIGFTDDTRRLAEDLAKKVRVVVELESIFTGKKIGSAFDHYSGKHSDSQSNKPKNKSSPARSIPPALRNVRLPSARYIVEHMQQHYASNRNKGVIIDHAILQYIDNRLAKVNRHADRVAIFEAVYYSEWAQPPKGIPFDADLFSAWMDAAHRLGAGTKVRQVLWAILDSGPELKVTSEVLLQARVAVPRTHHTKEVQARWKEADEAAYLLQRLKKRHWQQCVTDGRSPTIKWPSWNPTG